MWVTAHCYRSGQAWLSVYEQTRLLPVRTLTSAMRPQTIAYAIKRDSVDYHQLHGYVTGRLLR